MSHELNFVTVRSKSFYSSSIDRLVLSEMQYEYRNLLKVKKSCMKNETLFDNNYV